MLVNSILNLLNLLFTMKLVVLMCFLPVDQTFYSLIINFTLLYLSLFNIKSIKSIIYHETRSFNVCFTRWSMYRGF